MSALFRVAENGAEQYFQTERSLELLDAACLLRDCLRQQETLSAKTFAEMIPQRERIGAEEFHRLALLRMENTGEVAGAFDLDFDRREFSAISIMDGWKVFSMSDICAAADRAFGEECVSWENRWSMLLDELDGKEITWARSPLMDGDSFSFEDVPSGPTM